MRRKEEERKGEKVWDEYDKSEVNLKQMLDRMFFTNGRLFHHERILCWFPKYLEKFFEAHDLLMNRQDILPITWKYYLSIMAVSCYECEYLLKILEEQFLLYGGDIDWLNNGLKKVEGKLQKIGEINEIMAFKPWILSVQHIEGLIKSEDKYRWSVPEVL